VSKLLSYLWLVLLALYILSPLDAHPLFFDDLIASAVLVYMLYKNARQKKRAGYTYTNSQSQNKSKTTTSGHLTLDEAYRILGIGPDSSLDEVRKAYKEKVAQSHPDKVSHLSKELQDKAKELTLKLNNAFDVIKNEQT
jgi:DnaJ-domain-containing protein 1